jgi:hypothetical protein
MAMMLPLISALAAVALTMAALPAAAADRVKLPTEMLGTWCLQQNGEVPTYRRGDCLRKTDSWLLIGPDGYQGHEFGCKIIKTGVDRRNRRYVVYVLESHCEGEAQTWDATISMWLGLNDSLIVQTGEASPSRGRR